MNILELLEKEFPDCWFKDGADFDGGSAAVWSGEGSTIGDLEAFDHNSWSSDPKEKTYTMGVHNKLAEFVEARGFYWEAQDAGTYLLYK